LIFLRAIPSIKKNSAGKDFLEVHVDSDVGKLRVSVPVGTSRSAFEYPFLLGREIRKIQRLSTKCRGMEFRNVNDVLKFEKRCKCLPISLAIIKGLSLERHLPVWKLLFKKARPPLIISKIFGGGKHTSLLGAPEFQEFLVFPTSDVGLQKNIFLNKLVYKRALKFLKREKITFTTDIEGGIVAKLTNEQVLNLLANIVQSVSYESETELAIGIDVAASSFFIRGRYKYLDRRIDEDSQLKYIKFLTEEYNLRYVEDPFHQNAFDSFRKFKRYFRRKVIICGDDLVATRLKRLRVANSHHAINACIIKPNQCYSLSETLAVMKLAKKFKYLRVFSHRSVETPERIFADLAMGCEMYKISVVTRERMLKLRRLIEILNENGVVSS